MKKNLHIITGASKGLGAGIARYLDQQGDQVVSISRSGGVKQTAVRDYKLDLEEFSSSAVFERIFSDFPQENFEKITLTNNAGIIEPISQVINLSEGDVLRGLAVNLYAPIALTAEFLRRTSAHHGDRVILNVSSGVARRPKASWSIYSAAKAGLEAFSIALQRELSGAPVRIITFDPGIMDTAMQARIRSSSASDFPELQRFIGFKNNGELLPPETVGSAVGKVLLGRLGLDRQHLTIEDLLSTGAAIN